MQIPNQYFMKWYSQIYLFEKQSMLPMFLKNCWFLIKFIYLDSFLFLNQILWGYLSLYGGWVSENESIQCGCMKNPLLTTFLTSIIFVKISRHHMLFKNKNRIYTWCKNNCTCTFIHLQKKRYTGSGMGWDRNFSRQDRDKVLKWIWD